MEYPLNYNLISHLINLLYTKSNFTYDDLAKKIGVSVPVIGKILRKDSIGRKTLFKCVYFLEEHEHLIDMKDFRKAFTMFGENMQEE